MFTLIAEFWLCFNSIVLMRYSVHERRFEIKITIILIILICGFIGLFVNLKINLKDPVTTGKQKF